MPGGADVVPEAVKSFLGVDAFVGQEPERSIGAESLLRHGADSSGLLGEEEST